VLYAQQTKDKQLKGELMTIHKQMGLLAAGLLAPRVLARLAGPLPAHVPGTNTLEQLGATLSHYAAYGFIFFMPVSGVSMGYYSGNGIPFFFNMKMPGASAEHKDGALAKQAYVYHKLVGQALEYFVPLHVAGAFWHVFRGHTIFARILPGLAK